MNSTDHLNLEFADVQDLLSSLVQKSLIAMDESTSHYHVSESVREYAREKVSESDDDGACRDRHARWYLMVAEAGAPRLSGTGQEAWLDAIAREDGNFRLALETLLESPVYPDLALRMCRSLWLYWRVRGDLYEGRSWIRRALERRPELQSSDLRIPVLNAAGCLAAEQGDYESARRLHEECLAMRRTVGDRRGIAGSLGNLGVLAAQQGDNLSARALYTQCLEAFRETGDENGIALSLNNLGDIAYELGDRQAAIPMFQESLALFRKLGANWNVAGSLHNLAICASEEGELDEAQRLYEESIALRRTLSDRRGIAEALEGIAYVAGQFGMPAKAVRLYAAASHLRDQLGSPIPLSEVDRMARQLDETRTALRDGATFDQAWKEGRAMSLESAVEYALKANQINGMEQTA